MIRISDLDCFYVSFDEPQKQIFWKKNSTIFPKLQWVDGIKGFDSAHKRCAELSKTERFVTIDGDCLLDPNFGEAKLKTQSLDSDFIISWASTNSVNGLRYGNGGIKCWPRDIALQMQTHENAINDDFVTDFCYSLRYEQRSERLGSTHVNATPFQAFRAGFREGVKLGLNNGKRIICDNDSSFPESLSEISPYNFERLRIWCSVGADVRNGLWAILGARFGCIYANIEDQDLSNLKNYDWISSYWQDLICAWPKNVFDNDRSLIEKIKEYGDLLKSKLKFNVPLLNAKDSLEFKANYINPDRSEVRDPKLDVFFLSYDEPNADLNWQRLRKLVPYAKRVHKIDGILNAHKKCAELASTEHFFVVDGDAVVNLDFDFRSPGLSLTSHDIYVWRSKIALNGLVYGYGAIKLLPKAVFSRSDFEIDMTSSITKKYNVVNIVGSECHFNSSPLHAWRGAFRECAKLASRSIAKSSIDETEARLKIWCTLGIEEEYGIWALKGANEGRAFGLKYNDDPKMLNLINDFEWLSNEFEKKKYNERLKDSPELRSGLPNFQIARGLYRSISAFPHANWNRALSDGQLISKQWLLEKWQESFEKSFNCTFILGGWYGVLAAMIFNQKRMLTDKIRSFDLNPECSDIAEMISKVQTMDDWRFKAITLDINRLNFSNLEYEATRADGTVAILKDYPDLIINTSCEHIEDFQSWYASIPTGMSLILQSNNFYEDKEHVNCSSNLSSFSESAPMSSVHYTGCLNLDGYDRFMLIGIK